MQKRKRVNPPLLIGLIGTFTIGSHFVTHIARTFWSNPKIWWAPRTMQLSLAETRNTFELFLSKRLLQKHIEAGTLFAVDEQGRQYRVAPEDFGVQLNNWPRIKASSLTSALFSAFGSGVALTCLVLGLVNLRRDKRTARE